MPNKLELKWNRDEQPNATISAKEKNTEDAIIATADEAKALEGELKDTVICSVKSAAPNSPTFKSRLKVR